MKIKVVLRDTGTLMNLELTPYFSILHVDYHKETYLDNSNCKEVFSTLTGYVDEDFIVSSQNGLRTIK